VFVVRNVTHLPIDTFEEKKLEEEEECRLHGSVNEEIVRLP